MAILEQLRRLRADMPRGQFAELHPYAFLVPASRLHRSELVTAPRGKPKAKVPITSGKPTEHFDTTLTGPTSDELATIGDSVFPLRKAAGNLFPDRISIGRAAGCDIVLADASVSKLHGHFHGVRADAAVYTDAKSANRTYIDGVPAQPGASVEIRSLGLIALGRVRLQLLSSSELYDWL